MNTSEKEKVQLINFTALSAVIYVLLMLAASISLIFVFNFPDILREPVEVMLASFNKNSDLIIPSYYLFVLSGLAFIFMVILIHKAVVPKDSTIGLIALVCGILFGLTSNLGFIRWPFLMDYLASAFNDPATTQIQKDTIKLIFNSFHNYAGVAVGENFAFWFEGFWTIFISLILKKRNELFPSYIGNLGIVLGIGMLIYTLEQFGGIFAVLGFTNVIIHAGFLIWLLSVAVLIFKSKDGSGKAELGMKNGTILIIFYLILLLTAYL